MRCLEAAEVHPSTTQGPLWIGHEPPRHGLVEPKTADLVPGELAGRLFSLLEPQDVDETDSAVRSDRRVPQLPAVAEVNDVLPG
jgi:hypothetical protein